MTNSTFLIMTLANGVVSFLAMILNIAQFVHMIRRKKTKLPFEKTLLSLALADFLTSISHCLFYVFIYIYHRNLLTFPALVFGVLATLVGFSVYSSLFHSIFIAVQRIYAVLLPIKFRIHFKSAVCLVSLVVIWIASLCMSVVVIYREKPFGHSYIILAISGILPLFYCIICCRLRSQRSRVFISTTTRQQNDSSCRTFIYSILVTAAFLFCTLPIAVYIQSRSTSIIALKFTELMLSLNPVADSLLYFAFSHMSQKKYCFFPRNIRRVRVAEPLAVTRSSHLELPQIEETKL